jgi:hypothetical protein
MQRTLSLLKSLCWTWTTCGSSLSAQIRIDSKMIFETTSRVLSERADIWTSKTLLLLRETEPEIRVRSPVLGFRWSHPAGCIWTEKINK